MRDLAVKRFRLLCSSTTAVFAIPLAPLAVQDPHSLGLSADLYGPRALPTLLAAVDGSG
jgi:hypothetical protein